jgi:hypothetical protein
MKKIINSIGQFVSKLFSGSSAAVRNAIKIGISVTNAIKDFDTSKPMIADIITSIIPGNVDDRIKDAIRANLPKILIELKLVDATLGLTNPDQIVIAASKTLNSIVSDYSIKAGFLNSLSIVISQVAADGKLDWNDAAYLVKWIYDNKK